MVLNMKIAENYMEKVYAGWLGKIIGIRLWAPIEGWTYQRIRDVFGEVWSYPANYKNFAADDDSNGPLFFIRALEDCKDLNNFSSHEVANALLNYAPYEHGFFWWGGYGISTEHTAYLLHPVLLDHLKYNALSLSSALMPALLPLPHIHSCTISPTLID